MAGKAEYRDDERPVYSMRWRRDTRHDITSAARDERTDASALITEATEAMLGYTRCGRCGSAVPARFGDLSGMTLREAVAAAVRAVAGQKCRDHEPVRVGAAVPAVRPGTALFMEPGGVPAAEFEVPEVRARRGRS